MRVELEVMDADRSTLVGTVAGQEAGLERDERGRRGGADGRRTRDSGVRIEAARDIQRKNGERARVGARDPLCGKALDRTPEPDPEQAVDNQSEAAIGPFAHRRAVRIVPGSMGGRRVGTERRGVATERNDDVEKPGLEPARDHERVAAIVARAGQDQHARGARG
jgi:hypothetical protein